MPRHLPLVLLLAGGNRPTASRDPLTSVAYCASPSLTRVIPLPLKREPRPKLFWKALVFGCKEILFYDSANYVTKLTPVDDRAVRPR